MVPATDQEVQAGPTLPRSCDGHVSTRPPSLRGWDSRGSQVTPSTEAGAQALTTGPGNRLGAEGRAVGTPRVSVTGPLTVAPPSASRLWKTDTALEEAGDCFRKGWVDVTQVLPSSTRGHPGQHLRWSSACRRALCPVSLGRGDRGLAEVYSREYTSPPTGTALRASMGQVQVCSGAAPWPASHPRPSPELAPRTRVKGHHHCHPRRPFPGSAHWGESAFRND